MPEEETLKNRIGNNSTPSAHDGPQDERATLLFKLFSEDDKIARTMNRHWKDRPSVNYSLDRVRREKLASLVK